MNDVIQIGPQGRDIRLPAVVATVGGADALIDAAFARNAGADMIELRMDISAAEDKDPLDQLARLAGATELPILVTYRDPAESGPGGPENVPAFDQRLAALEAALEHCAAIDIELANIGAAPQLVEKARAAGVAVVGSCHYFEFTPGEDRLLAAYETARTARCDVFKVAAMPADETDVRRLLVLCAELSQFDRPLVCAISMGALGRATRVIGPLFGSVLCYGCIGEAKAPGQIEISEMIRLQTELGIPQAP